MPPKDITTWNESNYTYVGSSSWNTRYQWDDYMQRLEAIPRLINHRFFINFIATSGLNQFYESFPWDEFTAWATTTDLSNGYVILDAHTEGPCYEHVAEICDRMTSEFNLPTDHILLWTGSIADGSEPIGMIQNLNAFSLVSGIDKVTVRSLPSHHFVMLARVPRRNRIDAAVGLIRRDLEKYGYISCGCGNYGPISAADFDGQVPDDIRHKFPMFIDGYVEIGYNHPDAVLYLPQVTGAFCNIIAETSHEYNKPGWFTAFATEKSEKCFLLEQVPIWVGAYRQADAVRRLGFDLFDDLIDHSYDEERDTDKRLNMVLDEVQRICKMDLVKCQRYKWQRADRFKKNAELCRWYRNNFMQFHFERLLAWINR